MADGRMLKKAISTSKKLAALKTDTARLLYTWLLPQLDIEGRFSGDPDVIKGYIFPRIKTISADLIQDCLFDLQGNKLIKLYRVRDDDFLEFFKFLDHQQLRADREAKSIIPSPKEGVEILREPAHKNPFAPGELRDNSGITPAKVKLNKVKLNKESIDTNLQTDMSVEDKSNQLEEKSAFVFEKFRELQNKFPNARYQRQIQIFIESFLDKRNPDAITHCLNQLLISKKTVPNPKAYLEKILSVENGNYNERESVKEHERHKEPIPIKNLQGIESILKQVGSPL